MDPPLFYTEGVKCLVITQKTNARALMAAPVKHTPVQPVQAYTTVEAIEPTALPME
ncbi:hypothetical protein D3C86_2212420 [compost metagenome]